MSNGYAADHQSYCGPKKVRGKIWNLQDLGDNVRSYQQGWALMQIRQHRQSHAIYLTIIVAIETSRLSKQGLIGGAELWEAFVFRAR